MYAITGATGNIGRRVTEALLSAGKQVRVIGRSDERLEPLVENGAEAFVGSVDDAEAMARAFAGAEAVYVLIPPDFAVADYRAYQNRVSEALNVAISKSGVRHVVNLSSIGAERSDRLGVINGLHDNEVRMNRLAGVNVLHLRPALFMDSLLYGLGMIKQTGMVGGTQDGDIAVPMIATSDIAAVAAEELLELEFFGKSTRDLLGQRDITMHDVARAFGAAIGNSDLGYIQVSEEAAAAAMISLGLGADAARLLNELRAGVNDGIYKPSEPRSPENTTPTSIEQFAEQVFAPAYRQ
jgi:uncharacterized protein YbjT (DUF2867 family)